MAFAKVGNFTKATTVSNQVITHGLGEVPKVIIIWGTAATADTILAGAQFGIGYTVMGSPISYYANCFTSASAVTTVACQSVKATSSFVMCNSVGTTIVQGAISAADATTMTLNWTTNNAVAYRLHFAVIGGTYTQAKLITHQLGTGILKTLNIGFRPNASLFLTGTATAGIGRMFFGVTEDNAGTQGAFSFYDTDASLATTSHAGSASSFTPVVLSMPNATTAYDAFIDSVTETGYVLNDSAQRLNSNLLAHLALRTVRSYGNGMPKFGSDPTTVIDWVGFRPDLVIILSNGLQNIQLGGVGQPITANLGAGMTFGASDGTTTASSAIFSKQVSPTDTWNFDRNNAIISTSDSKVIDNLGTIAMTNTGFTITWSTTGINNMDFYFLALGGYPAPTFRTTPRRGMGVKVIGHPGRGVIKI